MNAVLLRCFSFSRASLRSTIDQEVTLKVSAVASLKEFLVAREGDRDPLTVGRGE
jgi:hypothetical protein